MNLPTEIFGDVIVAHAPDELHEEVADQFERFLANLDRPKVVVDLDDMESIDSAGLTALLNAQSELQDLEGDLKVTTSNHVNRKILEITRLDEQLEVFDSVIDAVKSFV
ncbi:MAG: STAS domain-containing protein [Pirellulaceae bacterium]